MVQYYSNQFPDYLLQRYFNLFDEVIIVARIEYEAKPPVGESLITLPVRVIHIPMNRINKITMGLKSLIVYREQFPVFRGLLQFIMHINWENRLYQKLWDVGGMLIGIIV